MQQDARELGINLTKVAVGCETVDILRQRLAARATDGESHVTTRFKPKRADELVGGSLFWIFKHRLIVRQRILGFAEGVNDAGRASCLIRVDMGLVGVRSRPKRAHQGWRYLEDRDAPADLAAGEADLAEMPPELLGRLTALALL